MDHIHIKIQITLYMYVICFTFTISQQTIMYIHYIRTKLYFVPLKVVKEVKASPYLDFSTPRYRLNSMIMDVAHHRLFKPPQIMDDNPTESCRQFLKLKFNS